MIWLLTEVTRFSYRCIGRIFNLSISIKLSISDIIATKMCLSLFPVLTSGCCGLPLYRFRLQPLKCCRRSDWNGASVHCRVCSGNWNVAWVQCIFNQTIAAQRTQKKKQKCVSFSLPYNQCVMKLKLQKLFVPNLWGLQIIALISGAVIFDCTVDKGKWKPSFLSCQEGCLLVKQNKYAEEMSFLINSTTSEFHHWLHCFHMQEKYDRGYRLQYV